jgi:hypothetical protein
LSKTGAASIRVFNEEGFYEPGIVLATLLATFLAGVGGAGGLAMKWQAALECKH